MKKTDKIAVLASTVVILSVTIYLTNSGVLGSVDSGIIWIVCAVFIGSIVFVVLFNAYRNVIIRNRIREFKKIAKDFSLTHNHISPPVLFTSYGILNELKGNINGHTIKIVDLNSPPSKLDVAVNALLIDETLLRVVYNNSVLPSKPLYQATKIEIDGNDKTKEIYSLRQTFTDVFLEIDLIRDFLGRI